MRGCDISMLRASTGERKGEGDSGRAATMTRSSRCPERKKNLLDGIEVRDGGRMAGEGEVRRSTAKDQDKRGNGRMESDGLNDKQWNVRKSPDKVYTQ